MPAMKSTSTASYILKIEKENAELKIMNNSLADDIKTYRNIRAVMGDFDSYEESRTKIENLKKLLTASENERVQALEELNTYRNKNPSMYDETARVTDKKFTIINHKNIPLVDHLMNLCSREEEYFKSAAYKKGYEVVADTPYEIIDGEDLLHIKGIGKSIASKINEFLEQQDPDYEESVCSNDYESDTETETDEDEYYVSYNQNLANAFDLLASLEYNDYKCEAYSKAARTIKELDFVITDVQQIAGLKGFGKSIISKTMEFLKTGTIRRLEQLQTTDTNQSIAWTLDLLADLEDGDNGSQDKYKVKAYKNAADIISNLDFEVMSGQELAEGPDKIRGIGKSIASKIDEYLQTGYIKRIEELAN
jgi:DNA polymerase/3'-5' exonuclease PolX